MRPDPKPTKKSKQVKKLFQKKSIPKLVKELDRVFSLWIRNREQKCFTCGSDKNLQCGHYISRRIYALRWDEQNCQTQCLRCNVLMHGNMPTFALKLQQKYGKDILEKLDQKKNNKFKLEGFELELLIRTYGMWIKTK